MSKYTIVKKDNNGIIVGDISFGLTKIPYLDKSELFLNDDLLIRRRKEKISKENVMLCNNSIEKIINGMSILTTEKYFEKLFEIKSFSELDFDIDRIMNMESRTRNMNKKLFTSIFIKKIVKNHYLNNVYKLSESTFNVLLDNRIVRDDYDEIMREVLPEEADKVLSSDLKNLCLKSFVSAIDDRYYSKEEHMCWTPCVNADPISCLKIRNPWDDKKLISEYPFITEGFQIFKDGELDRFYVIKCNNHVKSKKNK